MNNLTIKEVGKQLIAFNKYKVEIDTDNLDGIIILISKLDKSLSIHGYCLNNNLEEIKNLYSLKCNIIPEDFFIKITMEKIMIEINGWFINIALLEDDKLFMEFTNGLDSGKIFQSIIDKNIDFLSYRFIDI